jgi:hypothetical protein
MAVEAPPRPDDAVQNPDDFDPDEGALPTGDLVVEAGGQLSLSVGGGKQPTSSTLRLVGGRLEVDGQYAKGESVVFRVECVVSSIEFKDEHDAKTGQVVGCNRNHRARITGIAVV